MNASTAQTDIAAMQAPVAPDLLASAKMVVDTCNPLPLNAKQHIAFAYLTNAIHRVDVEQSAASKMLAALDKITGPALFNIAVNNVEVSPERMRALLGEIYELARIAANNARGH